MSCSKWVGQISRMLDESLADDDLGMLEKHLAGCSGCRAEVVLQKKIETALKVDALSGLPADFAQRVGEEALRIEKRARRTRLWLVLVPPLAAGTAAVVFFFLGMDLAAQSPSMFEPVASVLVKPLVWASQVILGLFGGLAELQRRHFPSIDWTSGSAGIMAPAMLIGSIPALWGFRKILVYLK